MHIAEYVVLTGNLPNEGRYSQYLWRLVYAAITSASLSLLTTGIDSVFDIGSNILLFYLHKKAMSLDINKWPVGGTRLQTIGNIVYGTFLRRKTPPPLSDRATNAGAL